VILLLYVGGVHGMGLPNDNMCRIVKFMALKEANLRFCGRTWNLLLFDAAHFFEH